MSSIRRIALLWVLSSLILYYLLALYLVLPDSYCMRQRDRFHAVWIEYSILCCWLQRLKIMMPWKGSYGNKVLSDMATNSCNMLCYVPRSRIRFYSTKKTRYWTFWPCPQVFCKTGVFKMNKVSSLSVY